MTLDSENPAERRRKRLRYQAWHRGMREMDLLLGPFADQHLNGMRTEELDELERLLAVPDTTLYRWVSGQEEAPADYALPMLARLKDWALGSSAR